MAAAVNAGRRGYEERKEKQKEKLRDALINNSRKLSLKFKAWDEDGNGKVSQSEFRKAMLALGFQASKAQMDNVFDQVDKDGDGIINVREMILGLRREPELANLLNLPSKFCCWNNGSFFFPPTFAGFF